MSDDLWQALVTRVGVLGDVTDHEGRLVLVAGGQRLEMVMTPDEWDDLVSIPYGQVASAVSHVITVARQALADGVPYIVYRQYDLHPSAAPELPDPWAEMNRLVAEIRRINPDAEFGWYAHKPQEDSSA